MWNFIHQLHKSLSIQYVLAILDEFTQLSSAKQIYWQIRETLLPPIYGSPYIYDMQYQVATMASSTYDKHIPFNMWLGQRKPTKLAYKT